MDPQAAAAQKATSFAQTQRLKYAFQLASMAMLYYDYSLTFSDELNYIWRRRWRLSSLFYVFCRYALVANLLYFISIRDDIPMDCDAGYITCSVLSIFGHIGIIAVWGLRTYAICDKNKIVAVLLGFPGIATIIMLIVRAPVTRCQGPVTFPGIRGGIAASMVVFDVLAFSLASLRAWRTIRADRKAGLSVKSSADYVIFSQGLNYMAPVFGLSVASISMNWTVVVTFSRFMNAFKLPLSGLITARFLLELRKWEETGKGRKGDDRLSLPQWAYDPSSEQAATASIPRFSVRDSTGSIFTDLGGDIGPRRRHSHDEDFEDSEQMSGYESEGITTRRSSIRKGKQREESPDQATSTSQVVSLSARRHTFAEPSDISSPVQNAASSQCRERALTSPRLNRKGSD